MHNFLACVQSYSQKSNDKSNLQMMNVFRKHKEHNNSLMCTIVSYFIQRFVYNVVHTSRNAYGMSRASLRAAKDSTWRKFIFGS